jgi:hypothetical protein
LGYYEDIGVDREAAGDNENDGDGEGDDNDGWGVVNTKHHPLPPNKPNVNVKALRNGKPKKLPKHLRKQTGWPHWQNIRENWNGRRCWSSLRAAVGGRAGKLVGDEG